jgi:hypothetical protein
MTGGDDDESSPETKLIRQLREYRDDLLKRRKVASSVEAKENRRTIARALKLVEMSGVAEALELVAGHIRMLDEEPEPDQHVAYIEFGAPKITDDIEANVIEFNYRSHRFRFSINDRHIAGEDFRDISMSFDGEMALSLSYFKENYRSTSYRWLNHPTAEFAFAIGEWIPLLLSMEKEIQMGEERDRIDFEETMLRETVSRIKLD